MAQPNHFPNRPATPGHAPDPATNYERARPEKEAGMGRLDSPIGESTPTDRPDDDEQAIDNTQPGDRQLNAHDDPGGTGGGGQPLNQINLSKGAPKQPDHSMLDEEPLGWDQAPTDIHDPERQRQPRTGGKGGTPDPRDRNTRD
ncbi:MAG TPA: hypothetical protein VH475_08910 [Tepidisphaeraceae bacterium]|jgi:hypothetical protein